ncbi:MAG: BrnT family toxin [Nitrospirae bacterium]|nr:BrnT family toxin [Nitrospirota bacterium]
MIYEWDEGKRQRTISDRGIDFADADRFEWDTANILTDDRGDYKEQRFVATGILDGRLYVIAFTMRGETVRIISLRKANKREVRDYEENTKETTD